MRPGYVSGDFSDCFEGSVGSCFRACVVVLLVSGAMALVEKRYVLVDGGSTRYKYYRPKAGIVNDITNIPIIE